MMHRFRLVTLIAILLLMVEGQTFVSAQEKLTVSYNLGETTVTQTQFAPDSRFYHMPVTLQGVLALPEGAGPFPVVLFMHGAYAFCTAFGEEEVDPYPCPPENDLHQYEGFTYLAQALAERGYIAVVPDLASEFNNGFGEPIFGNRAIQIVNAHLNALANGGGFGVDVAGKADLTQLFVVGHSRGGPLAVRYTTDQSAANKVSALALLTPAFLAPEAVIPQTLPVALVIAQCDGDVGTEQPLTYLNEQLPPLRPALTTIYTLPAGTHNAFSTQLEQDRSASCSDVELLAPETQRDFATKFLPDFFDMALATVL